MRYGLISLLVLFVCSGCNDEMEASDLTSTEAQTPTSAAQEAEKAEKQNMITVKGTIVYKQIEGGFWGLDGENGKKYMPSGINKDLLKDGMIVEVTGYVLEDVMTFQQYGQSLKVIESKMLDDSKLKRDPNSY